MTDTSKEADLSEALSASFGQRVRMLRQERNWSLEALAETSGVSRSMLSQIERGAANPTLVTGYKISRAFGLGLSDLVQDQEEAEGIGVIRAADKRYHYRSDKQCSIRTLSPLHLEKDVEFYELILTPNGVLRSAPHFEGTREFLTVQKGKVRLESADDSNELNRGDSAKYRADVPHAITNIGRGEAHIFLVVIYD